jgi:hypothetical protein
MIKLEGTKSKATAVAVATDERTRMLQLGSMPLDARVLYDKIVCLAYIQEDTMVHWYTNEVISRQSQEELSGSISSATIVITFNQRSQVTQVVMPDYRGMVFR